ncbi:hypothetical protein SprV_0301352500 [Sparganum proliferum]
MAMDVHTRTGSVTTTPPSATCTPKTACTKHTSTALPKAAFYRSRRLVPQRLREVQEARTARRADEIQGYADSNEWNNFLAAIKAVYGPIVKATAPLHRDDESTPLTEKTNYSAMGQAL